MVQYRKDAKLQTLDKYIQSGGERAVAIAIFSLSLQHVTNVPFRYVSVILLAFCRNICEFYILTDVWMR